MKMRQIILTTAVLVAAGTIRMHALTTETTEFVSTMAADDAPYSDGTKSMNEQRWQDAVTAFDKVIDAKGKRVDAALYWKAYSLMKLGNVQATKATCDQLRAQYAKSTWNQDCATLALDPKIFAGGKGSMGDPMVINPADGSKVRLMKQGGPTYLYKSGTVEYGLVNGDRDPNAEIKLLAMSSLLNQDPAKAIPLLRGMLTGDQPASVKKHALFILSQSRAPEADAALHDAAMGKMGVDVQAVAIQSIGIFRGKKDNATLVDVYRGSSDLKIKRSVVSALFISNDAPRLVDLARNEKDLNLKRNIVSQLALMKDPAATDYMMELLK